MFSWRKEKWWHGCYLHLKLIARNLFKNYRSCNTIQAYISKYIQTPSKLSEIATVMQNFKMYTEKTKNENSLSYISAFLKGDYKIT